MQKYFVYKKFLCIFASELITKPNIMKAIQITKLAITEVPVEFQPEYGCVAFQMVKFEYSFYGAKKVDFLDTKILANGTQLVIDGNGFIKSGTQIN